MILREPLSDALHRIEDLITEIYRDLPSLLDEDQVLVPDSAFRLLVIERLLQIKNDIGLSLFPVSQSDRAKSVRSE